jgi:hypothetical protein
LKYKGVNLKGDIRTPAINVYVRQDLIFTAKRLKLKWLGDWALPTQGAWAQHVRKYKHKKKAVLMPSKDSIPEDRNCVWSTVSYGANLSYRMRQRTDNRWHYKRNIIIIIIIIMTAQAYIVRLIISAFKPGQSILK